MKTIEELKKNKSIIFECISGSRAYGLDTPASDTDIKGVFILPQKDFYQIEYVPQITNETNDMVYYELKRFLELCYKNNPNIIEMLYAPEKTILYKHPLYDKILKNDFLTKKCEGTFTGYALSQVKKAKGLNKKIFHPMDQEKKSVLDFCYILKDNGTVPLPNWLIENGYKQENCGLTKIPHIPHLYALYYDHASQNIYRGIMSKDSSQEICLSSVPKKINVDAYLSFNPQDYSRYCKEYTEYWKWMKNRNEARYQMTIAHQKNYDSKNMMHTFRLLNMALEIANNKKPSILRTDREFLFKIKNGEYSYDQLISMIEEKLQLIKEEYARSDLREDLDMGSINDLLFEIRSAFYH